MARLRDDLEALNALASRAAEHCGLNPAFVEKDFWVTEVLRVASQPRAIGGADAPASFVFKGGTSLSRVFGLIDRFSEDVDLLVVFPAGPGEGARHAVLKQVDADVAQHLGVPGIVESSTTGVKRDTSYAYPSAFPGAGLKESVLLEMGCRGGGQPSSRHEYRSLVAEYAREVLGEGPEVWEEFATFELDVLAPERTLLEKFAAVHAAATTGAPGKVVKAGRHFYDIARLLSAPEVTGALARLGADGVASLVADIDAHSERAGFAWSPRPAGGYAASAAFDPSAPAYGDAKRGFEAALSLVYGPKPTFDEVLRLVKENDALL